jgi:hypothetical protein
LSQGIRHIHIWPNTLLRVSATVSACEKSRLQLQLATGVVHNIYIFARISWPEGLTGGFYFYN